MAQPYVVITQLGLQRLQGLQGVGLQPETLADQLLVRHSYPASVIETNLTNLLKIGTSLDLEKH
eukprot:1160886-Pelagomonas_calceolata.AAC.7